MATKRKSIVDEALIEAEQISEAFETNAKEILTHAMGSEIEQMVKESLEDLDGDLDDDNEEEATDLDDMSGMGDLEMGDDDGDELDLDLGDEDDMDLDDLDGDDEGEELDLDLDGDDLDLDDDYEDDEMDLDGEVDMIDLTGAEDSEVISVFKKMGPDDEIQVVRDGNNLDITDTKTNAEYRIDLGGGGAEVDYDVDMDDMGDMDDMDMDDEMEVELDDESMEESIIYEIEVDDELTTEEEDMDCEEGEDCKEVVEGSHTHGTGRAFGKKGSNKPKASPRHLRNESRQPKMGNTPRMSKLLKENTILKNNVKSNKSENRELKENQKEMVGALKILRQKLQEVAVFNSNLTYSVRLMTENATTKEEKVDIIKGMDEAKTLKESKSIYRTLVKEMSKVKTPIRESIDNKINKTKSSGAQIVESKVYINEELAQQKKLWEFNYKY